MSDITVNEESEYPKLTVNVTSQYPSISIIPQREIVIGGNSTIIYGSGGGGVGGSGPGPTGAQGIQGVQGIAGGNLIWTNAQPVTATVGGIIAGVTLTNKNAIEVLEQMLYPYQSVSFTSFSTGITTGSRIYEVGYSVPSATRQFTWSTSGTTNWVAGSIKIYRGSSQILGTPVSSSLNYNSSPQNYTHTAYSNNAPASIVFKIEGNQLQGSAASRTETHEWRYSGFWGASTTDDYRIAKNDIYGANYERQLLTNISSFTNTFPSIGQPRYIYYFFPVSFSTPTFQVGVGGLPTPFETGTVSITNQHGLSLNYKYYRTPNASSGSLTISLIV
jgi:hypothetical protein